MNQVESDEPFGPTFYGYALIFSLASVLLAAVGLVTRQVRRRRRFGQRLLQRIDDATGFRAQDSQDGVHTSSNRDSGVGVVFARGISGVFASGRHQPQCDNDHTGMNAGVFTVGGSEIEMTEIESND